MATRREATGYAVEAWISHPQFGEGTVVAVEAEKLTIKFRDGGVKQILDTCMRRRDR